MALTSTTEVVAQILGNKLDDYLYSPLGVTGNIFRNILPESPDKAILVESSGGQPDHPKTGYDIVPVRILVRGDRNPIEVEEVCYEIIDELQTLRGVFGVVHIAFVNLINGPVNIGRDKNDRHRFSLNFSFDVRNKTQHRV